MKILEKILRGKFNINLIEIKNVVMDSRKIEKGSLFFAINNGNAFVDKVLNEGASLVIADNYLGEDKRVIKVKNTVIEMQELAKEYRKALGLKVIGITGSNGKTTTKDLIYSVLNEKYKCIKTLGNYNNHIGLPYTILQANETHEVLILEMGMSSFGEIDKLGYIAMPDYGIITNIGDSHLETLKNRENVCKAKTELLNYVDKEHTILFGDDYYLKEIPGIKVGFKENNEFQITDLAEDEKGATFKINADKYAVSLNGVHNAMNTAMAIVVGKKLGLTTEEINEGLKKVTLTKMRFEKIEKGNKLYINDAYNASPVSMTFALETFGSLYKNNLKIAVLGDMLELGEEEIRYHREVIEKALELDIDKVYLYGPRMAKALDLILKDGIKLSKEVINFKTKEDIKNTIDQIQERKIILLKGSRGMKMEEIIEEK